MTEAPNYGFYPFWFWNDRLTAEQVRWQVEQMAEHGVRGFYIHSRQGLQQPYMSEAFMDLVDEALQAAEAHGMQPHLYDEYPYPSGVAGGEVVLGNPQFAATRLQQSADDVDGGHVRLVLPPGKLLSCIAYPLDADDAVDWSQPMDLRDQVGMVLTADSYIDPSQGLYYNTKRYFASDPHPVLEAKLPPGRYRVFTAAQVLVDYHKYWGHFCDVFNPQAVRRFIQLTHERYLARYGEGLGWRFGSIFLDETSPGWTDRLPEAFQARYGYDLLMALPALQDETHPDHLRVAHDLYGLSYDLFCEAFMAPISGWCRQHGLAYAGETDWVRFSQLRYMDIPGCDPGHSKVGHKPDYLGGSLRKNARAVASAAYLYGKQGALCECYHSMGWGATVQDAKFVAEGLLLMGITHLVPHGFFYSTNGLRKHDAPPSFFFQSPFWPLWNHLSQRVARIGEAFASTHIPAQVLVVDPHSGLPTRAQERVHEQLMHVLMGQHLDFLVVDTDILVESDIHDGRVRTADLAAPVVIVPPMRVVERPLSAWLAQFAEAGGTVLQAGDAPDWEALLAAVGEIVQPHLRIEQGGQAAEQVWAVTRQGAEGRCWLLLNIGDQPCDLELDAGQPLREMPLSEGDVIGLRYQDGRYQRRMQPFESVLLRSTQEPVLAMGYPILDLDLSGTLGVEPLDANVLRLYDWKMALRKRGGGYGPARSVTAVPLANQLAQGRYAFTPRIKRYFGHAPELAWPSLDLLYTCAFDNAYTGPVHFLLEPGTLMGDWTVDINGEGHFTAADLRPVDAHTPGSVGFEITSLLAQGRNEIRIQVRHAGPDEGLINAAYLAGPFGVELGELPRLTRFDPRGRFEAYEENGLPYYAGCLEYTSAFTLDDIPEGPEVLLKLACPCCFREASDVALNGGPFLPSLWEPRQIRYPTEHLRQGVNTLTVRVYTTLVRAFEGQYFDDEAHKYRDVASSRE